MEVEPREEDHYSNRPTKAHDCNKKGPIAAVNFCSSVWRDRLLAFSPYTEQNYSRCGIRKQGRVIVRPTCIQLITRPLQCVVACSTRPLFPTTVIPHLASTSGSHPCASTLFHPASTTTQSSNGRATASSLYCSYTAPNIPWLSMMCCPQQPKLP
jgi:hypothetical protein